MKASGWFDSLSPKRQATIHFHRMRLTVMRAYVAGQINERKAIESQIDDASDAVKLALFSVQRVKESVTDRSRQHTDES